MRISELLMSVYQASDPGAGAQKSPRGFHLRGLLLSGRCLFIKTPSSRIERKASDHAGLVLMDETNEVRVELSEPIRVTRAHDHQPRPQGGKGV